MTAKLLAVLAALFLALSGASSAWAHADPVNVSRNNGLYICHDNPYGWEWNYGQTWGTYWNGNIDACEQQAALLCKSQSGLTSWGHGPWLANLDVSQLNCPRLWHPIKGNMNYRQDRAGTIYYITLHVY